MSMHTATGRDTVRDLTVHTLTCAVASLVAGDHVDAAVLLVTAAEGAIELGDNQLAVDLLRQAQKEMHKCTSR